MIQCRVMKPAKPHPYWQIAVNVILTAAVGIALLAVSPIRALLIPSFMNTVPGDCLNHQHCFPDSAVTWVDFYFVFFVILSLALPAVLVPLFKPKYRGLGIMLGSLLAALFFNRVSLDSIQLCSSFCGIGLGLPFLMCWIGFGFGLWRGIKDA